VAAGTSKLFRRHWKLVAEDRFVTSVRVNEVPGTTAAVGPLIEAEKDGSEGEAAPKVLPA